MRANLPYLRFVLMFCLVLPAAAAVHYWDGGAADNYFASPANWTEDAGIIRADSYRIDGYIEAELVAEIGGDIATDIEELTIGENSSVLSLLTVNGGGLTTDSPIYVGKNAGSNGQLVVNAGLIYSVRSIHVGQQGAGRVDIHGGEVRWRSGYDYHLYVSANPAAGSSGLINLHGGVLSGGKLQILAGGRIDIDNGGVLILDGDVTAQIQTYALINLITAANGSKELLYDYDLRNPGKTTVTVKNGTQVFGHAQGYAATDDDFAVAVTRFWQQAPKRLVVDDGVIDVELWSEDGALRRFATGGAKTHELVVSFDAQGVAVDQMETANEPLLLTCTPDYYAQCGVVPDMPAVNSETAQLDALLQQEIDTAIAYQRDENRYYGMVNYGDTGNELMAKNSEIDMHKGALVAYLRYGDPDYFQFGIDMSRHNMDVDVNHYHPDNYRFVGGHCGHGEDHTTNNRFPYISHTWLEGYLLDYYLTGNRYSLEMASLTGRGLVHATNNLGVQCENGQTTTNSNSRSLGQTLINLAGLYEATYNPRYISTMDKTVEQCALGQEPDGAVPGAVNHDGAWGTGYALNDQSPQKAARVASGIKQYLRVKDNTRGFDYLQDMCDWIMARGSFAFKLGVLYHNDLGNRTLQIVNASAYMCDAFSLVARETGDRRYLDAAHNMLLSAYEFDWDWISGTDLNMARSYLYHLGQEAEMDLPPVTPATVYDSRKTIDFLRSLQNTDGGFGHWKGLPSDMESTCRAVQALALLEGDPANEGTLLSWIDSCRSDNELGYAVEPAWNEDVIHTCYAVKVQHLLGRTVPESGALIGWIHACQNNRPGERGGYGDSPRPEEHYGLDTIGYYHTWESIVLHTAYALEALDLLSTSSADPASCGAFLAPYLEGSGGSNCGFWSESFNEPVDPLSTLLLIRAYQELGQSLDTAWAQNTTSYLRGLQNADGGFSWAPGESSTLRHTWACVCALELLEQTANDPEAAEQWVRSCANADGGFGNQPGLSSEAQSTYFGVDLLGIELPEYSDAEDLGLLVRDWLWGQVRESLTEPDDGALLLHYKLDETLGLTAFDEQSYADGALMGFTGQGPWIEGYMDNAVKLDGIDDYVDIADSALADFHDRTITLWLRLDNAPANVGYIFGTKSSYRIYLTVDAAAQLAAVVEAGTVGAASLTPGHWYHVALVLRDTADDGLCDAALYVDGDLVGESFDKNRHVGLLPGANIGSYNNGTSSFGDITVDDFRIYQYPLGADEVAWLARSPADLNSDGTVNMDDFVLLVQNWISL